MTSPASKQPVKHLPVKHLPLAEQEAARRDYAVLKCLALGAVLLAAVGQFAGNQVDPDLWGHVRYGQDWLAEGQLPTTASHTFTATDYRWINHENLAELAFAMGFDRLGASGMLIAKCLIGAAMLGMMLALAIRRGARPITTSVVLLFVAINLQSFFTMRPQLLSFACCAVLVMLLELAFSSWRTAEAETNQQRLTIHWRWLMPVPALMLVWVNTHGAFIAGLCILGAYLLGRIIEAIVFEKSKALPAVAGLSFVGLLSLATIFANPYGIELPLWLVESLRVPRPEVSEWAALSLSDSRFPAFATLLLINFIAWRMSDRRRDWTQLIILTLVGIQAVLHLRHIAFFAILTGFWTPVHVWSLAGRARNRSAAGLPIARLPRAMYYVAVASFVVAIGVQSFAIARQVSHLPVKRSQYPVDALQFMAENDLQGRLVPAFNWAQYALAALAPESSVSFDGRFRTCYPQEVIDMNLDFQLGEHGGNRFRSEDSGPIDGTKALEFGQPDLVLIDRAFPHAVQMIAEQAGRPDQSWTLLYQDAIAQLWGRTDKYAAADSEHFVPTDRRVIGDDRPTTAAAWPAIPGRELPVSQRSVGTQTAKQRTRPLPLIGPNS